MLGTSRYVSLHLAADFSPLTSFVINQQSSEYIGFVSSAGCSSKLTESKEGVVGTLDVELVQQDT